MAGKVINRADLTLTQTTYDVAVLGAGLLGLACAFYLKKLTPHKSVVIIEQEGIPSEQGATYASPAIFYGSSSDLVIQRKLSWTHEILLNIAQETNVIRPNQQALQRSGGLSFLKHKTVYSQPAQAYLASLAKVQVDALSAMFDASAFPYVTQDEKSSYGSAEATAQHYGYGAVKLGCDLILNARAAALSETKLKLDRLEYNREMQRVVVKEDQLIAKTVIVALGANTAEFSEEAYGVLLPYKKAYRQYLRIEADARLPLENARIKLPVIQANEFVLRPQGEGLLIVPPPLAADPKGYEPTEGNMMGIRVGVRREILEQLIDNVDELPVLSWQSLNLGKTVKKIRGTWDVITPNGLPDWQQLSSSNNYSLVGGRQGFALGMATAYDLAANLAQVKKRPWD